MSSVDETAGIYRTEIQTGDPKTVRRSRRTSFRPIVRCRSSACGFTGGHLRTPQGARGDSLQQLLTSSRILVAALSHDVEMCAVPSG
jgi:hypothetical protein